MNMNDYISESKSLFYKHEISKNIPCDAYSMHTHNTYELLYFLSGDATHIIEDRKYKLKKGNLILIRPFRYHFIQIDSPADYERYDILFDQERDGIESVSLIPEEIEVINLSENPIADAILRRTDYYHKKCDKETFFSVIRHLLSELFYNLSISLPETTGVAPTTSRLLSEALRYINHHLCTLSSVEEIARNLFVSESYLFRLFKNELHQTPKKYITDKRLLLAQKMLSAGEKAVAVSEKCGFGDYTAFYRAYTALFGRSPSEEQSIKKIRDMK